MRRVAAVAALLLAIGLDTASAAGDSSGRLKEIERKIQETQDEAKSIESKADGVLGEMEGLDRSIGTREQRVAALAAEVRTARARKGEADRRIAMLDAELPRLRARFATRARGLYRLRRHGLVPVVFAEPRDWNEVSRYRRSLEAVLAHDHAIVAELRQNRAQAEAARLQAVASAAALSARRTDSERELESLRTDRAQKQEMLASLRGEGDKRTRLLAELKTSAEKVRALIEREDAANAAPFHPPPGSSAKLMSPLKMVGDQVSTARNGVEVQAAAGTPIQAVKAGRVVFAGWFTGYGKMVILDHGDHLYSVYGYASEISVASGQVVKGGDEIATVGATGPVAVTSLYFEIRDHGTPRDPASYISTLAERGTLRH